MGTLQSVDFTKVKEYINKVCSIDTFLSGVNPHKSGDAHNIVPIFLHLGRIDPNIKDKFCCIY